MQVLSASGEVIASSENVDGEPAITTRLTAANSSPRSSSLRSTHTTPCASSRSGPTPRTGPVSVFAAESLERSEETVQSIIEVLTITIPAILALVAAVTWWAVGRTLRPVRVITATLAEITATDLHRRVPASSTNDEIGTLADTVNDTLSRLDTAVERQRRFIADASHELRGPLAELRGDLEVSVIHPQRTDWDVVARDTLTDVDRLQHLTEDLLTLARLGADPHSVGAQPVDLAALIRDELDHLDATTLVIAIHDASTPAVLGSANHLCRVIRNLIDNAAEHATTRIDVYVELVGDCVELRVTDDGPGIPTADRARVLEPFVRLDTARTRDAGGTGLGLAIVDEIIRAHNGELSLDSADPTGLTVIVRLPSVGTVVRAIPD